MGDLLDKIEVQKLLQVLNERDIMFTTEDIQELMDSELEKPPEEMDTELIDLCASVVGYRYSAQGYVNPPLTPEAEAEIDAVLMDYGLMPKPEAEAAKEPEPEAETKPEADVETTQTEPMVAAVPAKRKVKVSKILLVAAVFVLGFAVALPVGAKLFNSNSSNGIVGFYSDFFKINLGNDEPTTADKNDLVNQMILGGLDSLILPEALMGEKYEKTIDNIIQEKEKTVIYINISNTADETNGQIMITQYKNTGHDMTNGFGNVPDNTYRYFKELEINGNKTIVFANDEKSYINYSDNFTNYEITLNCDFDTMVSIAETINVKG